MTTPDNNVPTVGDRSRLERSCLQIGIQAQMLIRSMLIRRYLLLRHLSTVNVEVHILVVLYDDSEKPEGGLLHGVFFLTFPATIRELLIISRLYFAFLITPPTHCVPLHSTSKIIYCILFFAFGVFLRILRILKCTCTLYLRYYYILYWLDTKKCKYLNAPINCL